MKQLDQFYLPRLR